MPVNHKKGAHFHLVQVNIVWEDYASQIRGAQVSKVEKSCKKAKLGL